MADEPMGRLWCIVVDDVDHGEHAVPIIRNTLTDIYFVNGQQYWYVDGLRFIGQRVCTAISFLPLYRAWIYRWLSTRRFYCERIWRSMLFHLFHSFKLLWCWFLLICFHDLVSERSRNTAIAIVCLWSVALFKSAGTSSTYSFFRVCLLYWQQVSAVQAPTS